MTVLEAFGDEAPPKAHWVEATGADRFLVAAPGVDEERLAEIIAAWEPYRDCYPHRLRRETALQRSSPSPMTPT